MIIGTAGMLGEYVRGAFEDHQLFCFDIDIRDDNKNWTYYGDIRDCNRMEEIVHQVNPEMIINLAALTDLEECEAYSSRCFETNTIGAVHLMEIAKEKQVPYIFISTAGIFSGDQEYFTEEDLPRPLGYYAKSKSYAENYILENYDRAWIFRAGWMMGGGKKRDKKFVSKIIRQVENGATLLRVVDDKLGTPTYAKDFAQCMRRVTDESLNYGVYNMVCSGDGSRYDVAMEMKRILGWENVEIEIVSSEYFRGEYSCPRPPSEKLINAKLSWAGKNYMRDWKVCLEEYLKEYEK